VDNLTINPAATNFCNYRCWPHHDSARHRPLAVGKHHSLSRSRWKYHPSPRQRLFPWFDGDIQRKPRSGDFCGYITLSVVVPAIPAGPTEVSIKNGPATAYSLDNCVYGAMRKGQVSLSVNRTRTTCMPAQSYFQRGPHGVTWILFSSYLPVSLQLLRHIQHLGHEVHQMPLLLPCYFVFPPFAAGALKPTELRRQRMGHPAACHFGDICPSGTSESSQATVL